MYIVEYYEYDWDQNLLAHGVFNCERKEDAWRHFEDSIAEHYHGKDFWTDINWDNNYVESLHEAEDGYNECLLHKWEGFDDDVKLSWKVDDTKYKTRNELWEKRPEFKDEILFPDKPYITDKAGKQYARLNIETFFDEKN